MPAGRRRILVVEDEPETAGQLGASLATSGYQAGLAINGNDPLSYGRSTDYAVKEIEALLSPGPWLWSPCRILIPKRVPPSSTSPSAACPARSAASRPIRSSIRFAVWGIVSALLTKTLRSSTFKLALICIGIFGAVVLALFGYVYWSTASYVRSRSDHAIKVEYEILRQAYAATGRNGLIATIKRRIANEHFEGGFYLLTDS